MPTTVFQNMFLINWDIWWPLIFHDPEPMTRTDRTILCYLQHCATNTLLSLRVLQNLSKNFKCPKSLLILPQPKYRSNKCTIFMQKLHFIFKNAITKIKRFAHSKIRHHHWLNINWQEQLFFKWCLLCMCIDSLSDIQDSHFNISSEQLCREVF